MFYMEGCQKSMFGLSRTGSKHDSQQSLHCGYPLGIIWLTFGVPENRSKNRTPEVWHMVPKGCQNGVTFGAKWKANSWEKRSTLVLTLPGTILGTMLTSFWYNFSLFWYLFLIVVGICF